MSQTPRAARLPTQGGEPCRIRIERPLQATASACVEASGRKHLDARDRPAAESGATHERILKAGQPSAIRQSWRTGCSEELVQPRSSCPFPSLVLLPDFERIQTAFLAIAFYFVRKDVIVNEIGDRDRAFRSLRRPRRAGVKLQGLPSEPPIR